LPGENPNAVVQERDSTGVDSGRRVARHFDADPKRLILVRLQVDAVFEGRQRIGPVAGHRTLVGRQLDFDIPDFENVDVLRGYRRGAGASEASGVGEKTVQGDRRADHQLRGFGLVPGGADFDRPALGLGQRLVPADLPSGRGPPQAHPVTRPGQQFAVRSPEILAVLSRNSLDGEQ